MDSRQADGRADIYSLGCTLHFLLAARPPYGGDTVMKRLTGHQQAAIPVLSGLRTDVPPGMQEVFNRMLAKRPASRYQSSQELVVALESLQNRSGAGQPQPMVAHPLTLATTPVESSSGDLKELGSIILPGTERKSRKTPKHHKSKSKGPLIATLAVVVLALVGAGTWLIPEQQPVDLGASSHEAQPVTQIAAKPTQPPAQDRPPSAPASTPTHAIAAAKVPSIKSPRAKAAATVVASAAASRPGPPAAAPAKALPAPLPPAKLVSDARLPVPAVEAQQQAARLVREVYKDDYAQAKLAEAKSSLAEKLLNESQQSRDDAAAHYVMLREARDLAVDAANPQLAQRATAMLGARYAIEPLKELAAALEQMAAKPHPADVQRAIAEASLEKVDEAQLGNGFDVAKRLADVGVMAARKAKDVGLSKRAIEVAKGVTLANQQWNAWQKAKAILAKTPEDPAANLAIGRYLLQVQGDWQQALVHLAKGPDGPLQELAAKSLKPPPDAAGLAELGDAWFSAIEKGKTKDKADLRAGAAYWYSQALPGLTGLLKAKVDKRMADLADVVIAQPRPRLGPAVLATPPMAIAPFDAEQAKQHQQQWAAVLGRPVEESNAIGLKLVLIPPGEFVMGASESEIERALEGVDRDKSAWYVSELRGALPQHPVKLTRPFWLAAAEVKVAEFRKFVTATNYKTEAERDGKGGGHYLAGGSKQSPEFNWKTPGFEQEDDCPAVQISWNDAVEFCNWLSRQERLAPVYVDAGSGWQIIPGHGYRLPTEAEWEFACRAGTTTMYFWGDDPKEIDAYCWYGGNSKSTAHPVGTKRPNAFGLFDMSGNAREWVQDWTGDRSLAAAPAVDPQGPASGMSRVLRSGRWNYSATQCLSAGRVSGSPSFRYDYTGFRVARGG
jgi:formylglycine-generating enzyme required for sulfatase activity